MVELMDVLLWWMRDDIVGVRWVDPSLASH